MSSILEKCGDIDDAIRQLTSLKLTAERKAAAAEAATTVTDDAGERPNFPVHLTSRERTRPAGARRAGAVPRVSLARPRPRRRRAQFTGFKPPARFRRARSSEISARLDSPPLTSPPSLPRL